MGGPSEPLISVRDPTEEGDPLTRDDQDGVFVALFRHHVANILSGVGQPGVAEVLRGLTTERILHQEAARRERANGLVDTAVESFNRLADVIGMGRSDLIGRFVFPGRLADAPSVMRVDREAPLRLGLRHVVVGYESELVRLALEGDPSSIRGALADHQRLTVADGARSDGAGFWIISLGE